MAVGDSVGFLYSTITTFQPASGVEIALTSWLASGGTTGAARGLGDYDSNGKALQFGTGAGNSSQMREWQAQKQTLLLTNSKYLQFIASSGSAYNAGFSGIQIK